MIEKFKLYIKIDKTGFIIFIFGILILLSSFPIYIYMESSVDRIASLSLMMFLISEFRLSSKLNLYTVEHIKKNIDIYAEALQSDIQKNKSSIKSVLELLSLILGKGSNEKLKTHMDTIKSGTDNMLKKVKNDATKMIILEKTVKRMSSVQNIILFFISITTFLWGFGTLLE